MAQSSCVGACLCGEIRFRVELPTLFCAHCHCTMCRRAHGAGYVTWFGVKRSQLSIEAGKRNLGWYRSSDHGRRAYCQRCGSSLFFETSRRPDGVDIVLANMEGEIDRRPELHVHFDQRVDWIEVADDLTKLGGESGLEPIEDASPESRKDANP